MKAQQRDWDDYFYNNNTCPYPPGSVKRTYWRKGWNKAKRQCRRPF